VRPRKRDSQGGPESDAQGGRNAQQSLHPVRSTDVSGTKIPSLGRQDAMSFQPCKRIVAYCPNMLVTRRKLLVATRQSAQGRCAGYGVGSASQPASAIVKHSCQASRYIHIPRPRRKENPTPRLLCPLQHSAVEATDRPTEQKHPRERPSSCRRPTGKSTPGTRAENFRFEARGPKGGRQGSKRLTV
jgi:hypothetical protein